MRHGESVFIQGVVKGGQVFPILEHRKEVLFQLTLNQGLRKRFLLMVCPCGGLVTLSSGSSAQGESRAFKRRIVSLKSPSRVRSGNQGVVWSNSWEKYFPNEESLFCPLCKSIIFYLSGPPNIRLLVTPLFNVVGLYYAHNNLFTM